MSEEVTTYSQWFMHNPMHICADYINLFEALKLNVCIFLQVAHAIKALHLTASYGQQLTDERVQLYTYAMCTLWLKKQQIKTNTLK